MFLSKHSNGNYYLFYIDELGVRRKVSTRSKLKTNAVTFLQSFKASEQERKAKLKRMFVRQFSEDFLNYSKTVHTPKTQRCFQVAFREFIRILGDISLLNIGPREIEKFLSLKRTEASDWTARKYYIALASAFEAAKRWNCIAGNPFRQVEKPKVKEVQPAFFTKPELHKFLNNIAEKDFRDLCICAVSAGLRLGELVSLRWSDIDFVRKVITVQNSESFTTKSGKNRVVPMNEQLWRLLAFRKESASSELVFHQNDKRLNGDFVSKKFKRYVRLAGVNGRLHFHSLRHTFASWLVQDGVPIYEVQKLLGHSSVRVTEIYSHLAASELHGAVNRLSIPLN